MIHSPPQIRTGFTTPAKGTRGRQLILLLLRPQGLSWVEAKQQGFIHRAFDFKVSVARIEFEHGFDIRMIGQVGDGGEIGNVYRIVGRHRWNGSYRAIVKVPDTWPNVRQ